MICFMDLISIYSTPCLNQFCWIWSIPGDLFPFSFSIAKSNSKALGWGTSGSAVDICLPTIINPMYIEELSEMFSPPTQNTVAVCKPNHFLIPFFSCSKLVTLQREVSKTAELAAYYVASLITVIPGRILVERIFRHGVEKCNFMAVRQGASTCLLLHNFVQ